MDRGKLSVHIRSLKESRRYSEAEEEIRYELQKNPEQSFLKVSLADLLLRNILQFLQLDLAPRLRKLPAGAQIIFFSDHGFVENPHFEKSDKYRASRYTHGEASPFEIIVPWAAVTKIR